MARGKFPAPKPERDTINNAEGRLRQGPCGQGFAVGGNYRFLVRIEEPINYGEVLDSFTLFLPGFHFGWNSHVGPLKCNFLASFQPIKL